MDKLRITAGQPLTGDITISGAKNAALPILCASLLTNQTVQLHNVPTLRDIDTTCALLSQIGVKVQRDGHSIELCADQPDSIEAPYELVKTMRASIVVLGPLLARFGEAKVSLPGGCAIGQRPVDPHIKGDRKSTRLNSSHVAISYAVFCLKKKTKNTTTSINDID